MANWEARIAELGIQLRDPLPAGGLYTSVVIDGLWAFTSGTVAVEGPPLKLAFPGRLGESLSLEDGQKSAAGALISTLGNLRGALGSLDRIERIVKLTGFVRATHDFDKSPSVMDGASELLQQIFGPELVPARSAVGVAALPGGASVELDTIVKLVG
jgi:enamine deaminase RidA (YjgF/YER057c/UK114 family)